MFSCLGSVAKIIYISPRTQLDKVKNEKIFLWLFFNSYSEMNFSKHFISRKAIILTVDLSST